MEVDQQRKRKATWCYHSPFMIRMVNILKTVNSYSNCCKAMYVQVMSVLSTVLATGIVSVTILLIGTNKIAKIQNI